MKSIITITSCTLIAISLVLSGCSGSPVTIKSVQAKDIVMANNREIRSEACGFQLLLFIPININNRLERALEDLQQKTKNEEIAHVSIEEEWVYWLVGTEYCTTLRATAYQKAASK